MSATAVKPEVSRPIPADRSAVGRAPVNRRWQLCLLAIVLAGLGVRFGYLFGWQNPGHQQGDTYYYHQGANLFARGRGFPNPFDFKNHVYASDAQHPPLTILLLAIPSVVGLTSYLDHQLWSCVLGTLSVAVVGLVGQRIAGARAGLVAAAIAAFYPNFWLNDPMVLSETPTILCCALLLLAAYRFMARPDGVRAAAVGVCLAAAILARAELMLLAILLVAPLVLRTRQVTWRRRLALLGVSLGICGVALAPWVGYNLERFPETEFVSTGLGSTLAVANCDQTYHGPFIGWWTYGCGQQDKPTGDYSRQDMSYRARAKTYIQTHLRDVPAVAAARVGRVWGFFRPFQQIVFDRIEYRQVTFNRIGLGMVYLLEALSVAGTVVLRRRGVAVAPLLALPVAVTLSAAAIYGTTRFRSAAEPALVLLAAVALDALVGAAGRRLSGRRTGGLFARRGSGDGRAPHGG